MNSSQKLPELLFSSQRFRKLWSCTYCLQVVCLLLCSCEGSLLICRGFLQLHSLCLLCFSRWLLCSSRLGALLRHRGGIGGKSSQWSEMCLIFHTDKLWETLLSCFCYICLSAGKFEVNFCHTLLQRELEVASGLMPGWLFLSQTFSHRCMFVTWRLCHSSRHKGTMDPCSRWPSYSFIQIGHKDNDESNQPFLKEKWTIFTLFGKIFDDFVCLLRKALALHFR